MKITEIPEIAALTTPEKILFLEDLWDSISLSEDIPIPDSHKAELTHRFQKHGEMPKQKLSLRELQERINSQK